MRFDTNLTRVITYVLLCGYSPFRSDDMKALIKETTEAKIEFHERYWQNVSTLGTPEFFFTNLFLLIRHTAKDFITSLLNPDPTRRLSAEEALKHPVCFFLTPVRLAC